MGLAEAENTYTNNVQVHSASDKTGFLRQRQVFDIGNGVLVGQVLRFCFYSKSYGTLLKSVR